MEPACKLANFLEELIKNQRLFIITDNKNNSGYYEFDNKEIHLLFGQDISVENYWSLMILIFLTIIIVLADGPISLVPKILYLFTMNGIGWLL